ncbi:hypothetical protein NDK47_24325 [Brevibacillus ruminantium]|uniref:Uncharacterized protein n=1 Tax=Brevibacillus ruminantium TaxID=2950604 RepID=A0ABY4WGF9_9BACL|nr:hypothetical protein [Brevibacillus ruminantium]USG65213.1 hypothetical protein NDK47_24325 [Brevibacillus ruminantium]
MEKQTTTEIVIVGTEEVSVEPVRVQVLINGRVAYDQEVAIKRRLDVEVIADKSSDGKHSLHLFRNASVQTLSKEEFRGFPSE